MIALWVLELGFALFLARTLLAVRPLGPWLRARPAPLRWGALVILAGALVASVLTAAIVVLAGLLFMGGILFAEFFDDAARFVARAGGRVRRPMRFGAWLLAGLLVASLAHYVLASGMYLAFGDTRVSSAFGAATFGLHAATLAVLALVVVAWRGRGADALPRRALYALALLYGVAWFVGYSTDDVLALREERALPLLVVGVAVLEFFDILFEAPERLSAGGRALPREALWDLFLAISFGLLLLLSAFEIARHPLVDAVLGAKVFGWLGLLAGAALVPLQRARVRRRTSG